MAYRIELSKTRQAVCAATNCKKEGTKIQKGELRQGTLVTINDHTSMKWRHWGCVTPTVLHNWKGTSGMDMELVDGFEDLPEEAQVKVKRALEQVHVDDEDWNGDLEMNRYNPDKPMQGMFVKASKKKKKAAETDDEETSTAKQPATKKRSRAKVEEDEEEGDDAPKQAAKKSKKGRKAAEPKEPDPEPVAAARSKKGKKSNEAVDLSSDAPTAPTTKKGRGKKAQAAEKVDLDMGDAVPAAESPPPTKKGRGEKKAAEAAEGHDHPEDDATAPKRQKGKRRGKKAAAHADEGT